MSNCLLYSVRYYDETTIWTNPQESSHRIMVINTLNIPYSPNPIAQLTLNGGKKKVNCTKLAMLYTKPKEDSEGTGKASEDSTTQFKGQVEKSGIMLQRKMSQSLFYERQLLQKVNMIAVIPVP